MTAAARLKSYVERIEKLDDEIAGLNSGKSDIYKEAKGAGYDATVMRMLIAERRKLAKDRVGYESAQELLDTYRNALEQSGTKVAHTRVHAREHPTAAAATVALDAELAAQHAAGEPSGGPPAQMAGEAACSPQGGVSPSANSPAIAAPEPDLTLPAFLDRRVGAAA